LAARIPSSGIGGNCGLDGFLPVYELELSVPDGLDLSLVPLPATLPLFATGLGALSLVCSAGAGSGRRRRFADISPRPLRLALARQQYCRSRGKSNGQRSEDRTNFPGSCAPGPTQIIRLAILRSQVALRYISRTANERGERLPKMTFQLAR